jgi:hypothetical protein
VGIGQRTTKDRERGGERSAEDVIDTKLEEGIGEERQSSKHGTKGKCKAF